MSKQSRLQVNFISGHYAANYILRNGTMMRFQITCKMIITGELGAELYEKQVLVSDVCRAALARLACCGAYTSGTRLFYVG